MRRWPGIPPLFDSETERGQPPGHTPLRPTLIHAAHFRPPPHVTAAVQAAAQRNHPKLEWCPRCKRRVAGIGLLGLFNRLGSRPRSALSVSAPSQPVTAGWRGQSATCQRVTATRAGPTPPGPRQWCAKERRSRREEARGARSRGRQGRRSRAT